MSDKTIHHARVVSTGLLICISIMFGATVAATSFSMLHFAGFIQEAGR